MSSTPDVSVDVFADRVAERGASLAPAGRRVVRFIDQNCTAVLASSAMELAASTGTSDATVVRSVQALGFTGRVEASTSGARLLSRARS